jgi:Xaa-Pro dipeptidase
MYKTLNVCDLTPREEIDRRIEALKERMEAHGFACALILQSVDLFYFTGTVQKGAAIIPVEGEPLLFIERSVERARMETPLEVRPIKRDHDVKDTLGEMKFKAGSWGMELDVLPVSLFQRWKTILGVEDVRDITPLIKDVRLIKSPFEIVQIIKAGEICTEVLARTPGAIREGASEVEIGAFLDAEGRKCGHQGILRMRGFNQEMMNPHVSQGYAGTIPSSGDVPISGFGVTHAIAQGPSINRIGKTGAPVIVDYSGAYNGYITDETRIFSLGGLKEIYFNAYKVSREIVEETMAWAKEGSEGKEIFRMALKKAGQAGLEDHFMGFGPGKVSFIGHGLGLEINELPVITARHPTILKEGMVFALEPKFIFPGEAAVGIEIDFIVKKDRLERVTRSSMDIVYL